MKWDLIIFGQNGVLPSCKYAWLEGKEGKERGRVKTVDFYNLSSKTMNVTNTDNY